MQTAALICYAVLPVCLVGLFVALDLLSLFFLSFFALFFSVVLLVLFLWLFDVFVLDSSSCCFFFFVSFFVFFFVFCCSVACFVFVLNVQFSM